MGHNRPTNKTPFEWPFVGGSLECILSMSEFGTCANMEFTVVSASVGLL